MYCRYTESIFIDTVHTHFPKETDHLRGVDRGTDAKSCGPWYACLLDLHVVSSLYHGEPLVKFTVDSILDLTPGSPRGVLTVYL